MQSRTTWILVLLAVLVGWVVYWDHCRWGTTDQAEMSRRRILDFGFADVKRVELIRSNQTIVAERSAERWDILQPFPVRASASAIHSILDGLEFAERKRLLPEKDLHGTRMSDFGLESPRLRVVVRSSHQTITLRLGGETPAKDAVYLQVEGRKVVEVVPRELAERLDRRLEDLRERTVMDFVASGATRLEIKAADRILELSKTVTVTNAEPRWMVSRPFVARADPQKVEKLLAELSGLRAVDFLSESPKDVHTYGLNEPEREITVWNGETGNTLWIGRALTNDSSKVCAKLKNANSIFTVTAEAARQLAAQVNNVRDRRVLLFEPDAVGGIELLRGTERMELVKGTNRVWSIRSPLAEPAENVRVDRFLRQLGELTAQEFVAEVAVDLDKFGLAAPSASLTLRGEGTNVLAQLSVGSADAGRSLRYVKRGDESFVYGVPPDILEWLTVNRLAWRALRLADWSSSDVTRVVLRRATGEEVLERAEAGAWRLAQPLQGVLDADGVQKLVDALCRLRADEFLADGRDRSVEYGLETPVLTVLATVAGKESVLRIGATRPDGQLVASWGDPPLVFTIASVELAPLLKKMVTSPSSPMAP